MKRVLLSNVRRGPALPWLLVLLALPLSACFESKSVLCESGLVCPEDLRCSGDGTQCIQTSCGDGTVQADEVCDDGNTRERDGCSPNCKSNETCGNGIEELDEICDDGNTASGDGCRADCKSVEKCGNSNIDPGEACDDGNTTSGDGCSSDCRSLESCGNGIVDRDAGELCDDGNKTDDDGCNSDCRTGSGCGNGKVDDGEECDDGNGDTNDGCAKCLVARCGDGYVDEQLPITEACDPKVTPTTCDPDCTPATCGDGFVNKDANEECDTLGASTTCTVDCKVSTCGDGVINSAAGEQCDPKGAKDTCDPDCTPAECGDGFVNKDAQEECDTSGETKGCTSGCKISSCGDGVINSAAGELCDDGAANSNTGSCLLNCTPNVCGDGHLNIGVEACDDNNLDDETECSYGAQSCTGCSSTCTVLTNLQVKFCGDTVTQTSDGEECDDGNTDTETSCAYSPTEQTCTVCSEGCKSLTLPAPHCGDGVKNDPDEACDDGARNGATSCLYGDVSCSLCSSDCLTVNSGSGDYCGDGTKNGPPGAEACDDGNRVNEMACPYGPTTPCTGACSNDCRTPLADTSPRYCGDRDPDPEEGCDDGNNLACGTCGAGCLVSQALQAAKGSITAVGAGSLNDGELLMIHDGTKLVVFEFDENGNTTTGHIGIGTTGSPSPNRDAMALRIRDAINSVTAGLAITATIDTMTTPQIVELTHDIPGSAGNQPILETVSNSNFSVARMSGGAGQDCPIDAGCASNADCRSNNCDSSTHKCKN